MLGDGLSVEKILDDFPDLEIEDIQACLIYASQVIDTTKLRRKSLTLVVGLRTGLGA